MVKAEKFLTAIKRKETGKSGCHCRGTPWRKIVRRGVDARHGHGAFHTMLRDERRTRQCRQAEGVRGL